MMIGLLPDSLVRCAVASDIRRHCLRYRRCYRAIPGSCRTGDRPRFAGAGPWTGSALGIAGVPARLASTAWPALFFGSILGAAARLCIGARLMDIPAPEAVCRITQGGNSQQAKLLAYLPCGLR